MLIDRPQITIPAGPASPSVKTASIGSMFYNTSLGALQVFTGEAWDTIVLDVQLSRNLKLQNENIEVQSGELYNLTDRTTNLEAQVEELQAAQDDQREASEDLLSRLNSTVADNLEVALNTHAADLVLHTPVQLHAFLSEIDLDEVNGEVINSIPRIKLDVAELSARVNDHATDYNVHVTTTQRALLDELSPELTAQELNFLSGVSSAVQPQLDTLKETKFNQDGSRPMTGAMSMAGHRVKEVGKPTHEADAVNKRYVDALALGLRWRPAVQAASTSELKLSGLQTVDDVPLAPRNRVLVKDQENPAENGVYVVASGSWSRSPDMDTAEKLMNAAVFIERGVVNAASSWIQIDEPQSFPGDPVQFTQFAAGSATIDDQLLGSIYGTVKELKAEIATLKAELAKKS